MQSNGKMVNESLTYYVETKGFMQVQEWFQEGEKYNGSSSMFRTWYKEGTKTESVVAVFWYWKSIWHDVGRRAISKTW